jgi:hypothetical protein
LHTIHQFRKRGRETSPSFKISHVRVVRRQDSEYGGYLPAPRGSERLRVCLHLVMQKHDKV